MKVLKFFAFLVNLLFGVFQICLKTTGVLWRHKKKFATLGVVLFVAACTLKEFAPELKKGDVVSGKVISVYDGDTLTAIVKNEKVKVRLYGIDAPEKKQRYGEEATKFARKICLDKKATIEIKSIDKYARKVGIVTCDGSEESLNFLMVKNGWAWAYTGYSKRYKADEIQARLRKKGLWRDANPQNPSDFRKSEK